jgi:hypothetical protein
MRVFQRASEAKWRRLEILAEGLCKLCGKDVLVSSYASIDDIGGFGGDHVLCRAGREAVSMRQNEEKTCRRRR